MKRPPKLSLARIFCVFGLIAAWFAFSNQCALAMISPAADATKAAAIHKCCGGKTIPQTASSCCKIFRVLPTTAAAKLVKVPVSFPLITGEWIALVQVLSAASSEANDPPITGPPGASSFAEVVLQRSLLSHAPPFLA